MGLEKNDKVERILAIYTKLMNGQVVNKSDEACKYGVNERSIQRDIDDIRNFFELDLEDKGYLNQVVYDRALKGYRLEQTYREKLTNSEVLALTKILLDSRAFTKGEMDCMLDKLIECCVPRINMKTVKELIQNEAFHYIEPQHKTVLIEKMWELGQAIQKNQVIEIKYQKTRGNIVSRRLKPVSIMFSEYYFYLAAFLDDMELTQYFAVANDTYPTIYRIDRIRELEVTKEHFKIPYSNRFEEGELRKRIQFMYGGKLQKVKFKYKGISLEAVLDRLPTAKVLERGENYYIVEAEVFGKGIDMWLRSQGDNIEVL